MAFERYADNSPPQYPPDHLSVTAPDFAGLDRLWPMELSQDSRRPVVNRLRRAQGQLSAVVRMLEEGADCEEVLTQLAAVGKAVDRAGFQIVALSLKECATTPSAEIDTERLERIFLSLA